MITRRDLGIPDYVPTVDECADHDPNSGPGSDQCMTCGRFALVGIGAQDGDWAAFIHDRDEYWARESGAVYAEALREASRMRTRAFRSLDASHQGPEDGAWKWERENGCPS